MADWRYQMPEIGCSHSGCPAFSASILMQVSSFCRASSTEEATKPRRGCMGGMWLLADCHAILRRCPLSDASCKWARCSRHCCASVSGVASNNRTVLCKACRRYGVLCSSEVSSMATCRFTPPNPKALTPARRGVCADLRNHGRVSEFTYRGESSRCRALLGFVTLMVPGSILWCRARAVLINPAIPAEALVWPICDFTLPRAMWCRRGLFLPKTPFIDSASEGSPAPVPVPCASMRPTVEGSKPASS